MTVVIRRQRKWPRKWTRSQLMFALRNGLNSETRNLLVFVCDRLTGKQRATFRHAPMTNIEESEISSWCYKTQFLFPVYTACNVRFLQVPKHKRRALKCWKCLSRAKHLTAPTLQIKKPFHIRPPPASKTGFAQSGFLMEPLNMSLAMTDIKARGQKSTYTTRCREAPCIAPGKC